MIASPTSPRSRRRAIASALVACAGLCSALGARAEVAPVAPPPDLSQMKPEPATASRARPAPASTARRPEAKPGQTGAGTATTSSTTQDGPGEPVVQRNVIEDDASRIEETRVRGQLQRVTVTPKNGGQRYEIMPGDGSGSESSRSTAGKRVWNVLQF